MSTPAPTPLSSEDSPIPLYFRGGKEHSWPPTMRCVIPECQCETYPCPDHGVLDLSRHMSSSVNGKDHSHHPHCRVVDCSEAEQPFFGMNFVYCKIHGPPGTQLLINKQKELKKIKFEKQLKALKALNASLDAAFQQKQQPLAKLQLEPEPQLLPTPSRDIPIQPSAFQQKQPFFSKPPLLPTPSRSIPVQPSSAFQQKQQQRQKRKHEYECLMRLHAFLARHLY